MPFNEELGERIRECFESSFEVTERKMFGGLAFMVGGHMCCGVIGDDLMVRVGPDDHDRYLALPHARPMDFTGPPDEGLPIRGTRRNERRCRPAKLGRSRHLLCQVLASQEGVLTPGLGLVPASHIQVNS